MISSRKYLVPVILVSVLTGVLTMSAAPFDKPEKEPIDKIVFVHYPNPKENQGKPPTKPGGDSSGTGTLCSDYKHSGIKWANPSTVSYSVNSDNSGVNSNSAVDSLRAAMDTWSNACGPLNLAYTGTTGADAAVLDNMNVISWANLSSSYPNAIALTTTWYTKGSRKIVEVDTQMNNANNYIWSVTSPDKNLDLSDSAVSSPDRYVDPSNLGNSNTYDIQNIMTHEAGHWIMLNDLYNSRDSELTMYGYGSLGEIKKDTLGYGDELGVEAVYGP